MLKILFSPSEGKKTGGTAAPMRLFGGLNVRKEILTTYNDIVLGDDEAQRMRLFGLKKPQEAQKYRHNIFKAPTLKAVERYDGVAYEYLDYSSLDIHAKRFIDERTIIFSNLFGPILASDTIPLYKVKQTQNIGDIKPDLFYKEKTSDMLDTYLQDSQILDLRAGYYEKFYLPRQTTTTLKFLKNGKVVSHWAKAYRGLVLRALAQNAIASIDALLALNIENLDIYEIRKNKQGTQIVYTIVN